MRIGFACVFGRLALGRACACAGNGKLLDVHKPGMNHAYSAVRWTANETCRIEDVRQNCHMHPCRTPLSLLLSGTTAIHPVQSTSSIACIYPYTLGRQATTVKASSGVAPQLCRPPGGHLRPRLDTHQHQQAATNT